MGNCYTPNLPLAGENAAVLDPDGKQDFSQLPPIPPGRDSTIFDLPGDSLASSFVVRLPTLSVTSKDGPQLRRAGTFLGQGHLLMPYEAQILEEELNNFFKQSKIWGRQGFIMKILLSFITEIDPFPRLQKAQYVKATRTFHTRCQPVAMISEGTVLRIVKWNKQINVLVDCEKFSNSQWLSPMELVSVEIALAEEYKCQLGNRYMAPEAVPVGWKLEIDTDDSVPIVSYQDESDEESDSCFSDPGFSGLPRKLSSERVSQIFEQNRQSGVGLLPKSILSTSTADGSSPKSKRGTLKIKDGFQKQVSWADQVLDEVQYRDNSDSSPERHPSGPEDLVWLISDANRTDYTSYSSRSLMLSHSSFASDV